MMDMMMMSAKFDLNNIFIRDIERNDGRILSICQCGIGDVGCVVWDAGLVLSKYLETEDFSEEKRLQNKTVVELGSGTGVVGLMAASCGANVVVTDLPECIPLMEMNINKNKHLFNNSVQADTLKWGDDLPDHFVNKNIDLILIADCIYYDECLEPLVKTIINLSSETTCVYCCFEERLTGNKPELQRKFFRLIGEEFEVDEIPVHKHDEQYRSADIHIMKFTKFQRKNK